MKKNIFVTGGAGYIGSHTVQELRRNGYQPIVYDNFSMGHKWATRDEELIEGDLADKLHLNKVLQQTNPLAVMHFAGSISVGESVKWPEVYFRNNVVNTFNLIETMVANRIKHFIFSSSASVYGNPSQIPIPEGHPLAPINPYGEGKFLVERVLHWYEEAHGIKFAILRYFNAAGADPERRLGEAHAPETHLIPIALEAVFGERSRVEIYGTDYPTPDGTCIRDYIHVTDLAYAHFLVLEYLLSGGESCIYNCGYGHGYSVRKIIGEVEKVTGVKISLTESEKRRGDPPVLVAESTKIKRELGWKPRYDDITYIIKTAYDWKNDFQSRLSNNKDDTEYINKR
jgi:UDP-glucose 4-epimerase